MPTGSGWGSGRRNLLPTAVSCVSASPSVMYVREEATSRMLGVHTGCDEFEGLGDPFFAVVGHCG